MHAISALILKSSLAKDSAYHSHQKLCLTIYVIIVYVQMWEGTIVADPLPLCVFN